jgi:hypothetical protein
MSYVIIMKTDYGAEIRKDIQGSVSLEKFTDPRILRIYKNADRIYKLYPGSRAVALKE